MNLAFNLSIFLYLYTCRALLVKEIYTVYKQQHNHPQPLNREVCGIGSYHAIILFQSKVVGIYTLIDKISSGLLCEDSYENAICLLYNMNYNF